MTFKELKNKAFDSYYPALFFERLYPEKYQHKIRSIVWLITGLMFVSLLMIFSLAHTTNNPGLLRFLNFTYGVFFIVIPLWMMVVSVQAFYNSFYFRDIGSAYSGKKLPLVSYALAEILYDTDEQDLIKTFFQTEIGAKILLRAGISVEDVKDFFEHRQTFITAALFSIEETDHISIGDYLMVLFSNNEELAQFFFAHGIQKNDLEAIVRWIEERTLSEKRKKQWWSRDVLGRIPGIGKNWTYGQTFYLDQYKRDLPFVAPVDEYSHATYGVNELLELENILVKGKGANALLISNDKEELFEIVARLDMMIEDGTSLPEIEHKRVVLFDTDLLMAGMRTKGDFETRLLEIMNEVEAAGNVILVIADFPAFINSAQSLGTDIISFMDRYFTSESIHTIGITDVDHFHTVIERNAALMERFEKIYIQNIDESNTVHVLQNEIISIENKTGIIFTYPALMAISESAVRYFPDAIMPDGALDLLQELTPKIISKGKHVVTKDDVLDLVKTKTGIPIGKIEGAEREKLINLEGFLHQRIIGQDEAVKAISNAVRRARSGINNPNRPLASFLFLGPTGVGKTETTKALAEVFFGAEAKIERLDMSEYSSADSLDKLIGSYEMGKPGILSSMLREHPYGVLLLDEFEKTIPEVMNLFLQILDEGFFSDMAGKKINARNLLIIATSNAGADIIWQGLQSGDDFSQAKDYIIDQIIAKGIFRPELVNRFDGVIVFHPLGKLEITKVAELQLKKLKERLATRGINLAITKDIIDYLVHYGMDPKFGARPMNRAIQDKIEQLIADKIIRGDYKPGSQITLETKDFS